MWLVFNYSLTTLWTRASPACYIWKVLRTKIVSTDMLLCDYCFMGGLCVRETSSCSLCGHHRGCLNSDAIMLAYGSPLRHKLPSIFSTSKAISSPSSGQETTDTSSVSITLIMMTLVWLAKKKVTPHAFAIGQTVWQMAGNHGQRVPLKSLDYHLPRPFF